MVRPCRRAAQRGICHRLVRHKGDSRETVPLWAPGFVANGSKCDIVFVDGLHSKKMTLADAQNMRVAAKPGAIVVMDDIVD